MTKKDLKTGMVVETNEGKRYLVLEELKLLVGVNYHMEYETHEDDLTYHEEHLTINKVYKPHGCSLESMLNTRTKPIWERKKEAKELTLSEVEKRLGYPVKIIKE